jgi:hypothetical protein
LKHLLFSLKLEVLSLVQPLRLTQPPPLRPLALLKLWVLALRIMLGLVGLVLD